MAISVSYLAKHGAIGALAGLAGTAAIAVFMQKAPALLGLDPTAPDSADAPRVASPQSVIRAADTVAKVMDGRQVPPGYERAAMGAVQFGFGAALGAAYGVAARMVPAVTTGRGALFGSAAFLAFDEGLLPALGLSGAPQDSPPRMHGFAFASHLIYAGVTEAVRRALVGR